ncbi:MAG: Holliday junction branch migration protein RuvA [Elusimicrobiota bacterium]
MIAHIRGKILKINETSVIAEAYGVGYEINCCESSLLKLKKGEEFSFHISSSFSMYEGQSLYGFLSEEEKDLFELFRSCVPQTGAKKALEYLNKAMRSPDNFKKAAAEKDLKTLTSIFGFTKKTAEKLADALKDKISANYSAKSDYYFSDSAEKYEKVLNALVSLGYKISECKEPLKEILSDENFSKADFEKIFKEALKKLSKGL